jgi:hypothetical protein
LLLTSRPMRTWLGGSSRETRFMGECGGRGA